MFIFYVLIGLLFESSFANLMSFYILHASSKPVQAAIILNFPVKFAVFIE